MERILTIDEFYKGETLKPEFVAKIKQFEEVVYEMVKIMNHIHETNYSYRFWKLIVTDYVNYKLQKKKILSAKIDTSSPGLKANLMQKLVYLYKSLSNFDGLKRINEVLSAENNITHGFHDIEMIEKKVGKNIPSYFPVIMRKGNIKKRERANKLAGQYSDFFYKNIILQLPDIFVEHFDYIYNLYPLVNPTAKSFHVSFIVSEYVKIMIAKYVENGAKLYFYSHGAGGGEIKDTAIFHDTSVSDNYYTWGWKINETEIPGKAYRCYGFKKIYDQQEKKILYDCALAFNALDESDKKFFTPITNYFLSNIDLKKYSRILARPRPTRKWENMKKQLSFLNHKNIILDSGRTKLAVIAAKTKVMITFAWVYPQTSFSECIYVDHPTVCMVIDWDYTTIFEPYYHFLIEQKVFHESVESLVDHLNKVNIDEWWSVLIKNPMYKEFKYKFLREV